MKQFSVIGAILCMMCIGCGPDNKNKKSDVTLRTVKQCALSVDAPDAMTQAERWAGGLHKMRQGTGAAVEKLTEGWKRAEVVRVWRVDDQTWRAVVAPTAQPEATDDVIVLNMMVDKGFRVVEVTTGKGALLWPTLSQ